MSYLAEKLMKKKDLIILDIMRASSEISKQEIQTYIHVMVPKQSNWNFIVSNCLYFLMHNNVIMILHTFRHTAYICFAIL